MTNEFELKLLKFADSELSPEEESCVLLDCEQSPERWKDLALAMITERRLTDAFAGYEDDDLVGSVRQVSKLPSGVSTEGADLAAVRSSSGWGAGVRNVAISVAVLMAFLIGRQQNQSQLGKPVQPAVVDVESAELQLDDDQQRRLTNQQSSNPRNLQPMAPVGMLVATETGSESRRHQTVDPWTVVSKPVITDEDRGAFSDAGLDVEEQNTIYIVSDADGGRWAIPWKAVNVRYSADQ